MMVWELRLLPFTADHSTLRGLATALSVLFGGIGPLLPYVGEWKQGADLGFRSVPVC